MDRYQALSKMCLNNWHYISEKTLNFDPEINFFTGHSGSGKSTVLDAMQIVLYADSNGRGFFNKAAKEDSDRTLLEYLRGMKVVQDNNQIGYLRNSNFSTSIVLEFEDTQTHKLQSIGVVFDVDVSVNEVNRMFFWHTGELAFNHYRKGKQVLSIRELREYIQEHYSKDSFYISRTNEKFRNELYGIYLGGLHPKHFPALLKKAIPFRMDMKLEDFVKNYICTENDIHMEDMQDSVAQYIRLKRRLEDTKREIIFLDKIREQYGCYIACEQQISQYTSYMERLDIMAMEEKLRVLKIQQFHYREDIKKIMQSIQGLDLELKILQTQRDEVAFSIQNSGYEHLEAELLHLNQMLDLLNRSKAVYDRTAEALLAWRDTRLLDAAVLSEIERMREYRISSGGIRKIKDELEALRKELEKEKEALAGKQNELQHKLEELSRQAAILKKRTEGISGISSGSKGLYYARAYAFL